MTIVDSRPRRSYTLLRLAAVGAVIVGTLSASIGLSAIKRAVIAFETLNPQSLDDVEKLEARNAPALTPRPAPVAPPEPARTVAPSPSREVVVPLPLPRAGAPASGATRGIPSVPAPPPVVMSPPSSPPPAAARTFIIFFASGSAELTAEGRSVADETAATIRRTDVGSVIVIGHDDTALPDAESMALSRRRAQAVADALITLGVPALIIEVIGRGETEPLVPTPDGVREPQNRRVTIDMSG